MADCIVLEEQHEIVPDMGAVVLEDTGPEHPVEETAECANTSGLCYAELALPTATVVNIMKDVVWNDSFYCSVRMIIQWRFSCLAFSLHCSCRKNAVYPKTWRKWRGEWQHISSYTSPIGEPNVWLIDWLIGYYLEIGWFGLSVDWSIDWLIDWLRTLSQSSWLNSAFFAVHRKSHRRRSAKP